MSDLKPRRIVICGAGGTGSWLSEGLARIAEYKMPGSMIYIIDGDHYEPRNAERQAFRTMGNKADVRCNELAPQFPKTFFVADARWVVDKDVDIKEEDEEESVGSILATELLEEDDLVYAMVDNFAARKALFDAGRNFENIDIFTGGNDDQLYTSIYHYQRRDGEDVTEHPGEYHEEYVNPPDKNPGEMSCQERAEIEGSTQTIAANMTVAGMLLGRTHKVIIEGKEDKECEILFDIGIGLANFFDRSVEVPAETEVVTA